MCYSTIPTKITRNQYEAGFFAIDTETSDNYLFWENAAGETKHLWVDDDSPENYTDCEKQFINAIQENGSPEEIEAYILPTSQAFNEIDLEALENGKIEWV